MNKKYFARIANRQVGPLAVEQLVEEGLRPTDYVWCKGMDDWQQAREVADICRHFRHRLHDLMHPALAIAEAAPQDASKSQETDLPQNYWQTRAAITQHFATHPEEDYDEGTAPSVCPIWLIIIAIIAFFPLGLLALSANKSVARAWNAHDAPRAHDFARRAKLSAGLALCVGLVIIATVLRAML